MRRAITFVLIFVASAVVYAAAGPARSILPTNWRVSPPSGAVADTGTMPQGLAVSPDGQLVAVVESGAGPAGLRVFEGSSLRERAYVALKGAFGSPVWDGNSHVWVALANVHAVGRIDVASGILDRSIDTGADSWPAAVALSPDGKSLAFSDDATPRVGFIDVARSTVTQRVATGNHPGELAYNPDATTVAVANRGARTITLIQTASMQARAVDAGLHPSAVAFAHNGTQIYVTLADDDALAIIDTASGKMVKRLSLALGAYPGTSPNAIAVAKDGTAYVTCGALGAVAVISGTTVRGFLPSGWYPDGVALDSSGTSAYVLNGKGESSRANPEFNPLARRSPGYIATNIVGSMRKIDLRPGVQTAAVVANMEQATAAPAHTVLRRNGPIQHVIYVIKENRSYDQVLSDIPAGDGDIKLLLFGSQVTPNQHAIAKRFGLFDRAFASAQVSANGHNWTDAAFANDYLERFWPPAYGNRRDLYDFEDGADASVPHNGFLWDAAARAHITYRNYGEFVTYTKADGGPVKTSMPNLVGHTATAFPGFNLAFSDLDRVAIWLREFRAFEKNGTLPALEILRLPNDHTAGTKPGTLTPQAYVAQNDYALGQILDTLSHSKYWKSSLVLVTEDDAQNGPDHVDAQRTTSYIAGPYARGGTDHTRYSTASLVRTIELVLGLPPLSLYDAHAQPMYAAMRNTPDLRPFRAIKPSIDITARNTSTAYGAARSAKMDFTTEDRADPDTLNEILYRNRATGRTR